MSAFAPIASDNITLQPRGAKRQGPAKSMQAAASRCPMLIKSIMASVFQTDAYDRLLCHLCTTAAGVFFYA